MDIRFESKREADEAVDALDRADQPVSLMSMRDPDGNRTDWLVRVEGLVEGSDDNKMLGYIIEALSVAQTNLGLERYCLHRSQKALRKLEAVVGNIHSLLHSLEEEKANGGEEEVEDEAPRGDAA